MADSLPDRLRSAIDETEQISQAAAGKTDSRWNDGGEYGEHVHEDGGSGAIIATGPYGCGIYDEVRAHIARHDPAAVLRRCAADRKILDLHPRTYSPTHSLWMCNPCDHPHPCPTVEALAEAYDVEV